VLLVLALQVSSSISAEQALSAYGRLTAAAPGLGRNCGAGAAADEVVVCGARETARDRLPLRAERFAQGEIVRHPGEPPPTTGAFGGGPAGDPSHLMQTAVGIARLVRSAVTGQDPGPP